MKKKVLALVMTMLMVFSMAGCGKDGASLLAEMQKAAAYEAADVTYAIDVDLQAAGQKIKASGEITAYAITESVQTQMQFTLKSLEVAGQKIDLTKGKYKISPVKLYTDGAKYYINTAPIKELSALLGTDLSKEKELQKEYILINYSDIMKQSGIDLTQMTALNNQMYDLYKNINVDLPIKQDGRKYTVTLTSDQLVDAYLNVLKAMVETKEMKETFAKVGTSEADLKQVIALYDQMAVELKKTIKGTTVVTNYSFEDNKCSLDVVVNIKAGEKEQAVTGTVKVKCTQTKADKKAIDYPQAKDVTVMDLNQAAEAGAAETPQATAKPAK